MSTVDYPELKILKEFNKKIENAIIEPSPVASHLYSEDLIDRRIYARVSERGNGLSSYDRAVVIIRAISESLEYITENAKREETFEKILNVMSSFIPLNSVVEGMRSRYAVVKAGWRPPSSDIEKTNTPLGDDPLRVLIKELRRCDYEWRMLAVNLNVPHNKVESIGRNQHSDDERLVEALQYWLDNGEELNWEAIVTALREIDQSRLAEMLKNQYILKKT
jgi:hypothetical protein